MAKQRVWQMVLSIQDDPFERAALKLQAGLERSGRTERKSSTLYINTNNFNDVSFDKPSLKYRKKI